MLCRFYYEIEPPMPRMNLHEKIEHMGISITPQMVTYVPYDFFRVKGSHEMHKVRMKLAK